MSAKDEATKWWADMTTRGEHIASTGQIPDQRKREFLVREGLLCHAARGYWVLKRPEDSLEEVFPLLYWQAVGKTLSRVGQWSIRGRSAVMILNGDQRAQKRLLIRTEKKSNWQISLPLGFRLSLVYDPDFDERLVRKTQVGGSTLCVDVPERVLVDAARLPASAEVKSFLAGTDFDLGTVEAIYAMKPKPIVFKRLVELAGEVDRPELAAALARIVQTHTLYRVVRRTRTEADKALPVTRPKPVAPPWVLRQEEQFEEFEQVLEKRLGRKIGKLKEHPLDELVAHAREYKKYDTYHSTTLEGYRITPEEVDALLSGVVPKERKDDRNRYRDEIRNRMAILGYSEAFGFVLKRIERDFGRPRVSEELVRDTYYHLFKPSADAGITDYLSLTQYRNAPAFIRGTPYVPPSYEKLPELMAGFEDSVNAVTNPIIKAILGHYWLATIHPYVDGNGRTARLLMDYLLLTAGYSWVTIRVDQRDRYFDALREGQVEGSIVPFGEFIVEMVGAAGRS